MVGLNGSRKNVRTIMAVVIGTVAVTSLVAAPMLSAQQAQATHGNVVEGRGNGYLTCNGGVKMDAELSFTGQEVDDDDGIVDLRILKLAGGLGGPFISGIGDDARVTTDSYNLKGEIDVDTICFGEVPTTFTLKGKCGVGQLVTISAANGFKGQFIVGAICTVDQPHP